MRRLRPAVLALLAALTTVGCEAARAEGAGNLRSLDNDEVTPALSQRAEQVLAEHADDPIGTEVPFRIGSTHYVARIEEHYNPPGGAKRPYGPHKGVTLFVRQ